MPHALVLGAGMVGSVMAHDLAGDAGWKVTLCDVSLGALAAARDKAERHGRFVTIHQADLSDARAITKLARGADVVLGALPSRIGLNALRAVLDSGRPYSDISFMAEDAGELNAYARRKGVTAVVDIGVAPGMSHLLAGLAARTLDDCRAIDIFVGGLPRERTWPFEYKAAFSPADVLEEYTRPARLVEHSRVVTRPALSEPELLDFAGAGTLEAFNTDGLRSLVRTLKVPFMREKTLRYPGHIALMRVMREAGLFDKTPVRVRSADAASGRAVTTSVRPLDVTSAVLFPKWTYQPGEEDLTVMRVEAKGTLKGARGETTLRWDLFDVYDRATASTSMARTTALPCTIFARMLAAGTINRPGVLFPEQLATPALVRSVMSQLAAKGVHFVTTHSAPARAKTRSAPARRTRGRSSRP